MLRGHVLVGFLCLWQAGLCAGEPLGDLIRATRGSIVRIEAEGRAAEPARHTDEAPESASPEAPPPRAAASGVVWDNEGHVVTVSAIVQGMARIRAVAADGTSAEARPLGMDPGTGIAVLKVAGLAALPARLGADVELGQRVVAGGYAIGAQRPFFSMGIVSDVAAPIPGVMHGCIQSDVLTPPGMGGGPLFNAAGRLVGINLAVGGEGVGPKVGFALPAAELRRIVPFLVRGDVPRRGSLGVQIATRDGRIVVVAVREISSATTPGLEEGDVILGLGGQAVAGEEHLAQLVWRRSPGEQVTVDIERGGKRRSVSTVLGAWSPPPVAGAEGSELTGGSEVLVVGGSAEKIQMRYRDETFDSIEALARAVARKPPPQVSLRIESAVPFAVVQRVIQELQTAGAARVEIMVRRD